METVKASSLPRHDDEMTTDISDWLDTVAKQEAPRSAAFRRTLSTLLGG